MRKVLYTMFIIFAVLFWFTPSKAADVTLDWDAVPGATGYKIQMSTDMGVTWSAPVDAGTTKPYVYVNVPEDRLIMFRASAYNTAAEAINKYAGVWYDHRQKLLCPTAMSVGQ